MSEMQNPEEYEIFKSTAARDAADFVPYLVKRLTWKPNEVILDFGCGAGSTAFKYILPTAEANNSVIEGMDISEQMVEYARNNITHPLMKFFHGDILDSNSPFMGGKKFDKIFAIYTFMRIPDYGRIIEKLFDVLKPGGEIGITVITDAYMGDFDEDLVKHPKWSLYLQGVDPPYADFYGTRCPESGETVLRKALLDAGFVMNEIRTEERPQIDDLDTLAGHYLSVTPFLGKIPLELRADLKQDYYAALSNNNTSTCDMPNFAKIPKLYSTVICLAKKPATAVN